MTIELEQEEDGRWIAEAPQIPGALAYGDTQREAISKVESLVLRILADRLDHGEMAPELEKVFTVAAWIRGVLAKHARSIGRFLR
jgi:predicted RNase H-like HicB family nuclease